MMADKQGWWAEHRRICPLCLHSKGSILSVCQLAFETLWPKEHEIIVKGNKR